MSNFSLIVVGDSVDEAMAPYRKYENTLIEDSYVVEVDKTEEFHNQWENYLMDHVGGSMGFIEWLSTTKGLPIISQPKPTKATKDLQDPKCRIFALQPCLAGIVHAAPDLQFVCTRKYSEIYSLLSRGHILIDDDKQFVKVVIKTNPNGKWSSYTVGGRYHWYFRVKPHALTDLSSISRYRPDYTSSAIKGAIDFDAMRDRAEFSAATIYDSVMALWEGLPKDRTWESILADQWDNPDTFAAMNEFTSQPRITALRNFAPTQFEIPSTFECTRDEFLSRARGQAILPDAILVDGQWYSKDDYILGDDGVQRKITLEKWISNVNTILSVVRAHERLTILDCWS